MKKITTILFFICYYLLNLVLKVLKEFTNKNSANIIYQRFSQAPIMESLPLVGFACWAIMSIATFLTYIVIGGGLGNVTHLGWTLTQGLNFLAITGVITGVIMSLHFLFIIYNKFANILVFNENKSLQKLNFLLIPSAFFPEHDILKDILSFNSVIPTTDPFFYNMVLIFRCVFEICFILALFLIYLILIGILQYIYNRKLPILKSFLTKNISTFWKKFTYVVIILFYQIFTYLYRIRFFYQVLSVIDYLRDDNLFLSYYNAPEGIAMGRSRVLHPENYSQIITTLKLQYINPDYILYVTTFIYIIMIYFIIITIYYMLCVLTTFVYRNDKFALSFPGGPASLNLFTKCFYIKSLQNRILLLLVLYGIPFILLALSGGVLYHYINIYEIG